MLDADVEDDNSIGLMKKELQELMDHQIEFEAQQEVPMHPNAIVNKMKKDMLAEISKLNATVGAFEAAVERLRTQTCENSTSATLCSCCRDLCVVLEALDRTLVQQSQKAILANAPNK